MQTNQSVTTQTKQNGTSTAIQNELSRLSKAQLNCEGVQARLFNLIVYTHEPRRTTYYKEVLKLVMDQFPCRIIFIQGNPLSQENHLNVKVSIEKNDRGVVCDEVFIEATGSDINRVYFLLLPLFVPDLPIYLFWGQDPTTENTILPHLQHFATRLIFDSEATDDLQQFSRDMLNRMESSSIPVIDMNWAHTNGWREVLAQVFDSPERFELLATATDIQIAYNSRSSDLLLHLERQAIYLQAWLASRLGWQFQKAEKQEHSQVLYYQSFQTLRQIQLIPQVDQNFESEEILEINIQGCNDCQCHLKRKSGDQIEVHASNHFECELPFTILMPTLRSGRTFMQEIFYQKPSDQYKQMLQLIRLVKWS